MYFIHVSRLKLSKDDAARSVLDFVTGIWFCAQRKQKDFFIGSPYRKANNASVACQLKLPYRLVLP
jgi:hypothetical protein